MQKRRESSGEKYKRRIRNRRIFVLSVLAVVIILCVCLFTPLFAITDITVTGNTLLAAEDVIAASGIQKGENVFRISSKKAIHALSQVAYIEGAEIKRKFPARIQIEIDEAKQDIIIDTPQEFVVVTVEGRVLEKTDDVTNLTSPIVYGMDVTNAVPAQKVETSDPDAFDMNLERIACFYQTSYWGDIDEFYVDDISNFMLVMKSGMKVTFGSIDSTESLQRKIKMMAAILPQIQQTDRSYLDLTTDKGYFGEYTDAELEEMGKSKSDENAVQPGDDENSGTNSVQNNPDSSGDDNDTKTNSHEDDKDSSANPSSRPSGKEETGSEGNSEDDARKKDSASGSVSNTDSEEKERDTSERSSAPSSTPDANSERTSEPD